MLFLQALNNLSDEQVEYQVRDRLSFTRFLQLGIDDGIPSATTLWLIRAVTKRPEAGRAFEQGQHVGGGVRRQRLSLDRDRGATEAGAE